MYLDRLFAPGPDPRRLKLCLIRVSPIPLWLPFPVPRRTPCRAASGSRDDVMLDKLGNNAASKKFVKAYDKYTLALCGSALVAYGMQQYFVRVSHPEILSSNPLPEATGSLIAPRTVPRADLPSENLPSADARPRGGTMPPRRSPRKCLSRKRKRVAPSDANDGSAPAARRLENDARLGSNA